jgi:hypothetical protein
MLAGDVPFTGESFVAVAMKHVNEPPPNLLEVRSEVSLRVAAAVDRALEKDPEQRFPTMDAFAAELDACLAELDRGDADATMVIPALRRRRRKSVSRWPVGITVLAVLAIAAIVVGLLTLAEGDEGQSAGAPIGLLGIGSYDPRGDDSEYTEKVSFATDGKRDTFWTTEHYNSPDLSWKEGVGVVLDAGRPVEAATIRVRTDTPGYTAQIRAGNLLAGPFRPVSGSQTVAGTTTFDVDADAPMRYYVIWITSLEGRVAHVNEVHAFGS